MVCSQDIGTGGPADSNGDDNIALLGPDGSIIDMFGIAGEDGTGTGHEFEDGRAERVCGTSASSTWIEEDWNIDNDSGGGDGNQYAPEGFDPGFWVNDSNSCVVEANIELGPCTASEECGDGFICQGGICVEEVSGCGDGVDMSYFSSMTSGDDSNYYLSSESYSWEDANTLANELGGHLVSINSSDENAVIESLSPGNNLWIGLYQNLNASDFSEPSGGWEWVTGECLDYLNWAGPEPNNDNGEGYGHMNIFGTWSDWNDAVYAGLPFVMEINCDPIFSLSIVK